MTSQCLKHSLVLFGVACTVASATPEPVYHALIAGYGPWATVLHNPSALVAAALNNTCRPLKELLPGNPRPGVLCFEGWNITVNHTGAKRVADSLTDGQLKRKLPDAIVHLGLEDGAKGLRVELAGVNLLSEPTHENEVIEVGRPDTDISPPTFDVGSVAIAESLRPVLEITNRSIAEMFSRDAGTFYCNEALYRTTRAIRKLKIQSPRMPSRLLPAGFVHLPSLKDAPLAVVEPAIASFAAALLVDASYGFVI